jgi:uncharacterized phage protein (TIGR01671 family)
MRTIKFRGKWLYNDEWVYGYLLKRCDKTEIYNVNSDGSLFWANVYPQTVGQFTGRHDKNGKEIYEGDIIQNEDTGLVGSVVYINESFALDLGKTYGALYFFSLETNMCQVIGNIYDGKELLEKTK